MPVFRFSAVNPKNRQRVSSEITSSSEKDALATIKKQGLNPIEIKEKKSFLNLTIGKQKVKQKDLVLFTRQLSTLISAGLPLIQALINTSDQTEDKKLKSVIKTVVDSVRSGQSLSKSMAVYPDIFNVIYLNLISAGEASGTLDKSLVRLADQLEKDADITKKIRSAFTYPVVVLVVMLLVMGFMVIKVLPAVGNLYKGIAGTSLPILTRLLLSLSHFIISFWWLIIIIIIAVVVTINYWRKTQSGRNTLDRLKMTAWPIGSLFMKIYMARFAQTASTLVSSGVPIIQVLEITSKSINNVHIEKTILASIDKVKLGKSLSETLENNKNFLPLIPSMLKIGEASGTIDQMLERLAIYYEKEVDDEIKNISTLIEPILMIVLGVFAFIIVAAVLLPIYSLAGNSNFTSGNV